MPIEPVACAASSDSTSPNRLSVTMTSNCFGPPHQLHGAIVGEDMRELHVAHIPRRAASCTSWRHSTPVCMTFDFSAEATLFDRSRARSKATRAMRCDFAGRIDLRVDRAPRAVVHVPDAARLAEIDAAGELADDQDVETGDHFGLQRGRVFQRIEADRRAQIREQLEILAQAQAGRARASCRTDCCPIWDRRPRRTAPRPPHARASSWLR